MTPIAGCSFLSVRMAKALFCRYALHLHVVTWVCWDWSSAMRLGTRHWRIEVHIGILAFDQATALLGCGRCCCDLGEITWNPKYPECCVKLSGCVLGIGVDLAETRFTQQWEKCLLGDCGMNLDRYCFGLIGFAVVAPQTASPHGGYGILGTLIPQHVAHCCECVSMAFHWSSARSDFHAVNATTWAWLWLGSPITNIANSSMGSKAASRSQGVASFGVTSTTPQDADWPDFSVLPLCQLSFWESRPLWCNAMDLAWWLPFSFVCVQHCEPLAWLLVWSAEVAVRFGNHGSSASAFHVVYVLPVAEPPPNLGAFLLWRELRPLLRKSISGHVVVRAGWMPRHSWFECEFVLSLRLSKMCQQMP